MERQFDLSLLLISILNQVIDNNAVYDCPPGFWGSQCREKCGHCEGGDVFCFVYDGQCFNGCAAGYTGKKCRDECEDGRHGQNCIYKCGHCKDSVASCNKINGRCYTGCKPGYQEPFCKTPCPYGVWGEECAQKCECSKKDKMCGCDHLTGECYTCDDQGLPRIYIHKVKHQKCLNQYEMVNRMAKYKPPSVRHIPFLPALSVLGLLCFFVFSNFMWWFIMVRKPKPKPRDDPVIKDRAKKRKMELKYKLATDLWSSEGSGRSQYSL